jgi:tRNA-Thr(GGU) m(6)t(6)A37 methyltransferase TsaA
LHKDKVPSGRGDRNRGHETEVAVASPIQIGTIFTPFKEAAGTPIQGALSGDREGEIVLKAPFQDGLADLHGFSHLILIYAFHKMEGYKLKVRPYLDKCERGIFATRSPCRPNPIGMTVVRLMEIDGCRLKVRGVDMLDETPLLDIKPSIPLFDYRENVKCGWFEPHLERLEREGAVPVADDRFHPVSKKGELKCAVHPGRFLRSRQTLSR